MVTYKLVKVENLKLEKSVELTDAHMDIIFDALNYFYDVVEDESEIEKIDEAVEALYQVSQISA